MDSQRGLGGGTAGAGQSASVEDGTEARGTGEQCAVSKLSGGLLERFWLGIEPPGLDIHASGP